MPLPTISTDPLAQKRGGRGVGRLCMKAFQGGVAGGWGGSGAERPGSLARLWGEGARGWERPQFWNLHPTPRIFWLSTC